MSYQNGYGNQGYGSYNPYSQSENPDDEPENPSSQHGSAFPGQGNPNSASGTSALYGQQNQGRPQAQTYGSSNYSNLQRGQSGPSQPQPATGGYDPEQGRSNYEMSDMDPYRILNETRDIDHAIDSLEQDLEQLKVVQVRYANRTNMSRREEEMLHQELQQRDTDIFNKHVNLTNRIKRLKQDPKSGHPQNAPQVGKVDRRMKAVINKFKKQDAEYRRTLDETLARQWRTVNPDATDAEIREAIQDSGNQQVFTQALMNSDRRGQAQRVADEVRLRNADIRKIEETMMGLNRLFQDLEAAVIQQDPAVTQIEQRGEEVTDHVAKANTELDGAVKKARAARRKKWWCLGIGVLIVIIIAVVIAVLVTVLKKN